MLCIKTHSSYIILWLTGSQWSWLGDVENSFKVSIKDQCTILQSYSIGMAKWYKKALFSQRYTHSLMAVHPLCLLMGYTNRQCVIEADLLAFYFYIGHVGHAHTITGVPYVTSCRWTAVTCSKFRIKTLLKHLSHLAMKSSLQSATTLNRRGLRYCIARSVLWSKVENEFVMTHCTALWCWDQS